VGSPGELACVNPVSMTLIVNHVLYALMGHQLLLN